MFTGVLRSIQKFQRLVYEFQLHWLSAFTQDLIITNNSQACF